MLFWVPKAVLDRYDNMLEAAGYKVQQEDEPGTSFHHLRWMLKEMRHMPNPFKQNRWLGFIQGVMIERGVLHTKEERDFTRPHFRLEREYIESIADE